MLRSIFNRALYLVIWAVFSLPSVVWSAPLQGLSNPSLALGVAGVDDWSTQNAFINVMHTARPWQDNTGAWDMDRLMQERYLNEYGYPVGLPPEVSELTTYILTEQNPKAQFLAGRYILKYTGTAQIELGGTAANVTHDEARKEISFDYAPGPNTTVSITIHHIAPHDPLRHMAVFHTRHRPLYDLGVVLNPAWVNVVKDWRMIRFMTWMKTNDSKIKTWDDRPRVEDITYAWRGVPHEVMIDLANQIGADPWFTMPHGGDRDYMQRFAEDVAKRLDADLIPYVEYSNELWNWQFDQAHELLQEAKTRWPDPESAPDAAWLQIGAERAVEMAKEWKTAFRTAGRDVRVVGAVQTGWPGLEEAFFEAPALPDLTPARFFDAYAVAGYFEAAGEKGMPQVRGWVDASQGLAQLAARQAGLSGDQAQSFIANARYDAANTALATIVSQTYLKERLFDQWAQHKATADRYGLRFITYEGGTHITATGEAVNDPLLSDFFQSFNYSDAIVDLYAELMDEWRRIGGYEFNIFVDISPPSEWGSWGGLRYLGDQTARWDQVKRYNQQAVAYPEERAEGAFQQGMMYGYRTGQPNEIEGTRKSDIILMGAGDDTITPLRGQDFIEGGAGRDTVILEGRLEDYGISARDSYVHLAHMSGNKHLRGIETLWFQAEERSYEMETLLTR